MNDTIIFFNHTLNLNNDLSDKQYSLRLVLDGVGEMKLRILQSASETE